MRRLFKKRQNVFIKLIHEQASLTLAGLEALKAYMTGQDPAAAATLVSKEKEADEARRILIYELNKTFITPFDREDIFLLSRTIDDVLDYAYSTVSEMEILKVEPTPYMQRMAALLRDAAYELSWRLTAWRTIPVWPMIMPSAPRRSRTGWKMFIVKRWQTFSAAARISST